MDEIKLTIAIPTYNRRERLLGQLESILSQPEVERVRILVLDNCSDYDTRQAMEERFGSDVFRRIKLHRNRYNIGAAHNVASLFLHCETEWCWTLGDDDRTLPGGIARVLEDIERYPDIAFTKYNLPHCPPLRETVVSSPQEFWDYYDGAGIPTSGELVFISNNVINLRLLEPYLEKAHEYSYTYLSHLVPMLYGLKHGLKVRFSPDHIVEYLIPDPGQRWNYQRTFMGITTALHLDLGLSAKHIARMIYMFMHVDHAIFSEVVVMQDKERSIRTWATYKQMYEFVYRYEPGLPLQQRLVYFVTWCYYRLGISQHYIDMMKSYLIHHPAGFWRRIQKIFGK